MYTSLNIHNIKKITTSEISRVDVLHEAYSRTLTIQDGEGNEVELTLFADSFGSLIFDPAKPVTQAESAEVAPQEPHADIPAFLRRQAD